MNKFDARLVILCAPIFSTLTSLLIISLDLFHDEENRCKLKRTLILYFSSLVFTSISYTLYFYVPHLFQKINWLFMLSIVFVPVFLYQFIYKITAIDSKEHFSYYHYVTPILLSIIMLILSIVTPIQEQMLVIKGNGAITGNSILFFIFSNKLLFRSFFALIYAFLGYRRLRPYRKYIVTYSSNEVVNSLHWVAVLLFFSLSSTILPIYGLFVSRSALAGSLVVLIQITILFFQHTYLTFHVLKGDYVLQDFCDNNNNDVLEAIDTENEYSNGTTSLKKSILNKNTFEKDIQFLKPYLDSNLKISDLAEKMGVNRTYLSSFINNEYDMNFNTYINQLREKEYNQLRSQEKYKDASNTFLAEKAGFGSYRSYTRFAAMQKTTPNS